MAAKRRRQVTGRLGRARQHQDAAGVLVEPVDEARFLRRAEAQRLAQGVQMAAQAAAALDRQTGRLVEGDQPVVPVEDTGLQRRRLLGVDPRRRFRCGRASLAWPLGRSQRRHADRLARGEAQAGLGAPAVDPHLAGAQELLQPAVAELGEAPPEPAVEPEVRPRRRPRSGFVRETFRVSDTGRSLGESRAILLVDLGAGPRPLPATHGIVRYGWPGGGEGRRSRLSTITGRRRDLSTR